VEDDEKGYSSYDSPFEWYPLLRSHLGRESSPPAGYYSQHSEPDGTRTTATILVQSMKRLKLATAAKGLDPGKKICQYEVPGGGVCRDELCEDVHLSRIVVPSGT